MCLFFCTAPLHAGSQLQTKISFYYRVGIGQLDLRSCKATVVKRNSAALRIMPRPWARLDGQSFVKSAIVPYTGTLLPKQKANVLSGASCITIPMY